jgi:hypothetical protein
MSGDTKDVAKNNQRDPNLRAATVARVNQLAKGGLTKAAAFEKISAETGRAKDAVQMLYYRAIRASKGGARAGKATKAPARGRASKAASRSGAPSGNLPALLNGIAYAINELIKHFEKTTEENRILKEQTKRLHAITSLVRGH